MAGEWIKMRTNLWNDPRVSMICDLTNSTEAAIIGGLYWLWSAADEHTEDGFMPGLSAQAIDRKTRVKGFGLALCKAGWIQISDDGITIERFGEHNGASAKNRATTAKRVANYSAKSKSTEKTNAELTQEHEITNGDNVSLPLAREEKRKNKDITSASPPFDPRPELTLRGVGEQTAKDWLTLRKTKKAVVTVTALQQIIAEADKAGLPLERALAISCRRGWAGFEANWLKPEDLSPASPPKKDWT